MFKKFCILTLLFAVVALPAVERKVLTIGNSFADSVFNYLPKIAASVPGCELTLKRANIGGCSLERHWNEYQKSLKDPEHKPYSDNKKKYNLVEMLTMEKWDIITLQQASPLSFRPESYQPWFKNLYELVKEKAPQAEVVIQMTWSYRPDHPNLVKWNETPDSMYEKLYGAYTDTAKEFHCQVIPTGLAVQLARKAQNLPEVTYTAEDFKGLKHPDKLPAEAPGALHWGYSWRKGKDGEYTLGKDLFHLNSRGQYLQSSLWFAFIFDKPTADIKFVPEKLEEKDAAFLRGEAQKALDQFKEFNTERLKK